MAEWLYEQGIGENRAILVERDEILEARIELPEELRAGAVLEGRLAQILVPDRRGLVEAGRDTILVEPLPSGLTEGQQVRVEITRQAIVERGTVKSPKGRITQEEVRAAPTLAERIGGPASLSMVGPDRFEQAGWSELLEEAASGEIPFPGGELRMSLTPAMTLFDVDGALPPAELAVAGARAAARAIRRMDISGSIGIDLPTLPSKADRQRAAAALDELLPQPFERTAVNGFGFLQLVRRRERPSLAERLQFSPAASAARALLRRAERAAGIGALQIAAAPAVLAALEARPDWLDELRRRTGRAVGLQADPASTTFGGHVQTIPA